MPPKFGTSGLRGLVTELTRELVEDYVQAFLHACPHGGGVFVGRDLRPSSPQIAEWVMAAAGTQGLPVTDCGALPTPALAMASIQAQKAAIMITGSHIPADRNGLKFYVPDGEITKPDETAILAALGGIPATAAAPARQIQDASAAYAQRYISAYGPDALHGVTLGIYQHSSVARDVMGQVMQALGATCIPLAPSDTFIPVDTEALDADTRAMLAGWCAAHHLDAVISTDGDADRPMLTDHTGQIIPGDVLGVLTARSLGAGTVITPVSSNSMVTALFDEVQLTRIGSPFVIAGMASALQASASARVVGFEANGGFLLGFDAKGPKGGLQPLMTRDCLLPIIAPLCTARAKGLSLADLVYSLPTRFTAADRLQGVAPDVSGAFIATLAQEQEMRANFFAQTGAIAAIDQTDGLRLVFEDGAILHLRPSGNAPELRCYAEADSREKAQALVAAHVAKLRTALL